MMAIAFMGYVLPWGQMSFWGATVITNLFSAIPFMGEHIAFWLWGGFSIGNATLTRFFSFHYALPFVLLGLVGLHLAILHQLGSTSPFGSTKNTDKLAFYPYFYVKDYFGTVFWFFSLCCFVIYAPDMLGHSDNYIEADPLVTPIHIVPEWYFLPYYALLRSIPNKLGGVFVMALSLAVGFLLPFCRVVIRSSLYQSRAFYNGVVWFFIAVFILLGFLGGQPIEAPYTVFAQLLAFGYFSFFIAIVLSDYAISLHSFVMPKSYLFSHKRVVLQLLDRSFLGWTLGAKGKGKFSKLRSVPWRTHKKSGFVYSWLWMLRKLSQIVYFAKQTQHRVSQNYGHVLQQRSQVSLFFIGHPYHLVTASPWPLSISFCLGTLLLGTMAFFHRFASSNFVMTIGLLTLLYIMFSWFVDIAREGTFAGDHSVAVQRGLKYGMLLFILSEVLFFFAFFWGFFHSSLVPAVQIGGVWPPHGISVFNPWDVPLLNTLILLTSGASVTWAHFAVRTISQKYGSLSFVFSGATRDDFWLRCRIFRGQKGFFHLVTTEYMLHKIAKKAQIWYPFTSLLTLSRCWWRLLLRGIKNKFKRFSMLNRYLPRNFSVMVMSASPSLLLARVNLVHPRWLALVFHQGLFFMFAISYVWYGYRSFLQLISRTRQEVLIGFSSTIVLGALFTLIQFYEYQHASYTIADSVYGSTFFLTTGFHGLHVLVGTLLLAVSAYRMYFYHFTARHHIGMEAAIWYWHFVDVVWLGLYISVYHWGGAVLV